MQGINMKPLNMDQVNKKVLEKKPLTRPEQDSLNLTGNYQDEDAKIYQEKRRKFFEISKRYQEFNENTFLTLKEKSLKDYENFIEDISGDFFEQEQRESEGQIMKDYYEKMNNYELNGKRERRKLVRNIHEKLDTGTEDYCIEPWFKRYLILNKFIHYARAVVLKNRLLKNLEKLKHLDEEKISELEKQHQKCKNESYSQLFARFL